ncbi:PrsW family intramembrane metalloprotease [Muriicola soli]|uniref:Protease PrsW n=1 Tax=Muriicola soli TaxID=2507538 RepID=A0A411EC58_9FLAO|nr:PrsW family glutamic-type intramembrane protease [Muriicola soli]QBA65321.1 PrsW family intramembrane metalloprotease [Muriicola soli]
MNPILKTSLFTSIIVTALFVVLLYPLVLIDTLKIYDLILVSLSVFPGFFIMSFIYYLDEQDKEPLWLLAIAFILGGVNLLLDINVLDYLLSANTIENYFLNAGMEALTVSLTEEILKFLVVILIIYPNKHFDEPFDGIVYSVFVGMGFATIENLTFVLQGSASLAVLRMVTAVPAHFVFAVIMGYYLGKAKSRKKAQLGYILLSILIPVIIHALYDFFLFIELVKGVWIVGIITLVLALFIAKKSIQEHMEASPFKK